MLDEAAQTKSKALPPEKIKLTYREVGETHVFCAQGFRGFYIGSSSFEDAYKAALPALGEHVSLIFGCKAVYKASASASKLKKLLAVESETYLTATRKEVCLEHHV